MPRLLPRRVTPQLISGAQAPASKLFPAKAHEYEGMDRDWHE